jgi:transposase-like protein
MNMHKNARLTPQGRLLLVRRVIEQGWTVVSAASAAGLSERQAYRWLARYRSGGTAALADRSSAPKHSRHQVANVRVAEIERRRRQRLSGPAIARELSIPVSTVGGILRRLGLGRLAALEPRPPVVRYQRERPGELVHIDTKKLGRIEAIGHRMTGDRRDTRRGAGWEAMHVCIDDASRLAYSEVLADERKGSAVPFLERAVAWFARQGVTVERVMTDNGPAYRSHDWRHACGGLALRHLHTRPYTPRTTDEVEQTFSALCMLSCDCPQATARRRAGCEVRAWPRSLKVAPPLRRLWVPVFLAGSMLRSAACRRSRPARPGAAPRAVSGSGYTCRPCHADRAAPAARSGARDRGASWRGVPVVPRRSPRRA